MTSATPKPRAGEHTKGPWEVAGATHIWSRSAKANIASCSALRTIQHVGYAPPDIRDIEETAANARRIVACVNACEGVPTEDLEQYPNVKEYIADQSDGASTERDQLRAREAELVAALEYQLPGPYGWRSSEEQRRAVIRAALSKVRGA